MPDTTLDGTYVTICDWHGRVVWLSGENMLLKSGEFAWQHAAEKQQEMCQAAISRVATLGEHQIIDCDNLKGDRIRSWMWPLQSPEMAICILSIAVPKELSSLSPREQETLGLLAKGHNTKEIAELRDVSVSTIHTHLRRAKEKTGCRNLESLTAFAARYCHPNRGAPAPGN